MDFFALSDTGVSPCDTKVLGFGDLGFVPDSNKASLLGVIQSMGMSVEELGRGD